MKNANVSTAAAETVYADTGDGYLAPPFAIDHRSEAYDPAGFDLLARIQDRHFWYRGRHHYLQRALEALPTRPGFDRPWRMIDLGGGCGGWVKHLTQLTKIEAAEIALADSSAEALRLARLRVGSGASYYRVDLMHLGWRDRWDVAFLLDVIEHLPDDRAVLTQVFDALVPGGYLMLTVPALPVFWSINDELAGHQRRYTTGDIKALAEASGFYVERAEYFVFFPSPLLYLTRRFAPKIDPADQHAVRAYIERTHRIPPRPVNTLLSWTLTMEERIGRYVRYPWGTSILAVLRKPLPRPAGGAA